MVRTGSRGLYLGKGQDPVSRLREGSPDIYANDVGMGRKGAFLALVGQAVIQSAAGSSLTVQCQILLYIHLFGAQG